MEGVPDHLVSRSDWMPGTARAPAILSHSGGEVSEVSERRRFWLVPPFATIPNYNRGSLAKPEKKAGFN